VRRFTASFDLCVTQKEVSARLLGRQSYLEGVTTFRAKTKRERSMAGKAG